MVKQRIIMHLGTLELPKSLWPKLAKTLEARLAGQASFFEQNGPVSRAADQAMEHYEFVQRKEKEKAIRQSQRELLTIDTQSLNTSTFRSLGPELVAHTFWQKLGFDELLEKCGLSLTEQALAQAIIVGRLINPASEHSTWKWLRKQTALVELLPADLSQIGKDPLYEIGDLLLLHKKALEKGLREREAALFPQERALFLYDLTNTYFEGSAHKNKIAHRGNSKEKRSDCPLVVLALVVDSQGLPIFSQIYKGNQSEPETLESILERLYCAEETLFRETLPTIVMDRGIATKDNIALIKAKEYPYVIIERRAVEKDYLKEFATARETFEKMSNASDSAGSVYVKKVETETGCRVLCLSEGRERKEKAMDTLKEERFLQDLGRLKGSIERKNILLATKVSERIGRIKERYPSIAGHYEISLELDDERKKVVHMSWTKKASRERRSTLTGCYVIETSHRELEAKEIWGIYTTLVRVEDAFRDLKTDLGLRPVHHQLEERTEAHLFISVLAYHLLISIERELQRQGENRRWGTVRDELSTHQRTTVIMIDAEDQIHHIRVSGIPESEHTKIYQLLKVKDPLKRDHQWVGKRL
ncbi:MAG: IS1634 family transposase [Desulfitobacterium hafniense]|nr:IS1634 family transposase [Desulfitobacterium hafniense]